VQFYAPWHWIT